MRRIVAAVMAGVVGMGGAGWGCADGWGLRRRTMGRRLCGQRVRGRIG